MAARVRAGHGRTNWFRPSTGRANLVGLAPILDIDRGGVGGAVASPRRGRTLDGDQLAQAMAVRDRMPSSTFLCLPVGWSSLRDPTIRGALLRPAQLRGIAVELVGILTGAAEPGLCAVASSIRDAGGLIAVQADEIWHRDVDALTDYAPRVVILGGQWVHGIERSERRQAIVETLVSAAVERDAWVMADGVSTMAELRALVTLGVALISGPVVGPSDVTGWPGLAPELTRALAADSGSVHAG